MDLRRRFGLVDLMREELMWFKEWTGKRWKKSVSHSKFLTHLEVPCIMTNFTATATFYVIESDYPTSKPFSKFH